MLGTLNSVVFIREQFGTLLKYTPGPPEMLTWSRYAFMFASRPYLLWLWLSFSFFQYPIYLCFQLPLLIFNLSFLPHFNSLDWLHFISEKAPSATMPSMPGSLAPVRIGTKKKRLKESELLELARVPRESQIPQKEKAYHASQVSTLVLTSGSPWENLTRLFSMHKDHAFKCW